MVGISLIVTHFGENEWSHVCMRAAEHAVSSNRSIVASLLIDFEISSVFKGMVVFPSHENGMEESPAFHQYSHLMVRPSGPMSVLEQPSLPQARIGASSPPSSTNSRFLGFQKPFGFFVIKMAWKNGRHSANIHV
jgi:hypothetical protein